MLRVFSVRRGIVLNKQRFKSSQETRVDVDVHQRRFTDTIFTPSPLRADRPIEPDSNKFKTLSLDNADWKQIHNQETFHHIPKLQHGLEVVLKGGIHKSNFGIARIPSSQQIDQTQFPRYYLPSQDEKSISVALKHKSKYLMSTSTITTIISHIYFLYSKFRIPFYDNIRPDLVQITKNYMISFRKPVTCIITKQPNGLITIDSDSKFYEEQPEVLMQGGKIMENILTMTKKDFQRRYLKKEQVDKQKLKPLVDHHNYLLLNKEVCIRSQIDCMYQRGQENPMFFEIKTRAASPIRYDLSNYLDYMNYQIRYRNGTAESFQREYYDLIRGSFMPYGLQILIGGMSGAVVAYHNTEKFFGFEFIQAQQIYRRIFGNKQNAEYALIICTKVLTKIVDHILQMMKNEDYKHIRLGVYADNSYNQQLNIFAQLLDQLPPKQRSEITDMDSYEIKDCVDYYTKYRGLKKVVKFNLLLKVIINGVQIKSSGVNISAEDHVQIKYYFTQKSEPTFDQYMLFTHEAEKNRDDLRSQYYNGTWFNRSVGKP